MTGAVRLRDPEPGLDLASVRAVLFDIDGVLTRGSAAQPHAAELYSHLVARGTAVACVTNNSCLTPAEQAAHLARLGVGVPAAAVVTSALATRRHLDRQAAPGSRLMVLGMEGLRQALFADGVYVEEDRDPDYVVVGLDLGFNYRSGRRAARALLGGAGFIAANADRTRPTRHGLEPEAGALVAFLEAATRVAPHVVGKPNPLMFEIALERMAVPREEVLVVGDNLDTDIAGADAAGLASVLVMNGVTAARDLWAAPAVPRWSVKGLGELLEAWRRA